MAGGRRASERSDERARTYAAARLTAAHRLLVLHWMRGPDAHRRWIGAALLQWAHAVLDLGSHRDERLQVRDVERLKMTHNDEDTNLLYIGWRLGRCLQKRNWKLICILLQTGSVWTSFLALRTLATFVSTARLLCRSDLLPTWNVSINHVPKLVKIGSNLELNCSIIYWLL